MCYFIYLKEKNGRKLQNEKMKIQKIVKIIKYHY